MRNKCKIMKRKRRGKALFNGTDTSPLFFWHSRFFGLSPHETLRDGETASERERICLRPRKREKEGEKKEEEKKKKKKKRRRKKWKKGEKRWHRQIEEDRKTRLQIGGGGGERMKMRRAWKVFLALMPLIWTANSLPYTDSDGQYRIPTYFQETVQSGSEQVDFGQHFLPVEQQQAASGFCNGDEICSNRYFCPDGYETTSVPCAGSEGVCCAPKRYIELGSKELEYPEQQYHENNQGTIEFGEEEQQDVLLDSSQTDDNSIYQMIGQSSTQETIPVDEPSEAGQPAEGSSLEPSGAEAIAATHLQAGCAAALLCVEEKYCTLDGTISPEPVLLTSKQILRRVPLSSCKNRETGVIGKCCRDPNYVDPWPTGNLPVNFTGGFDKPGSPTFLNIAKVPAPKQLTPAPPTTKNIARPIIVPDVTQAPTKQEIVTVIPKVSTQFLVPPEEVVTLINNLEIPSTKKEYQEGFVNHPTPTLKCGVKNEVARTPDMEESITLFGEIPWQAMVLHSEQRRILCSGALVGVNSVLTAGTCVDSLSPAELSIKLGEWKLGYESRHEEPLPFEILHVSSIRMHPNYQRGSPSHDLALLSLDRPATFDYHISPLCLPETENVPAESRQCITTGWGKSILQAHYAGSVMHVVDVDVLSEQSCQDRLANTEYASIPMDGAICTKTKKEKNNVCEADVGGPLACDNGKGYYELAGIYSQDTGCRSTDQVAVFAPVDKKWITESTSPDTEIRAPTKENYRSSNYTTDNQYLPPY